MSGSNRGNFIALGVAVLLAIVASALIYDDASNLQRLYEHQAEQNAQIYRDTAREHAQRACVGLSGSKLFECDHEQRHAARERERQEYDLQAQLVTSVWTRAMGLAALIAMGVGILGVGLVYTTFNATREANVIARQEAERNAREAERSALETAAARRHIIQTERAVLSIEGTHIVFAEEWKWIELSLDVRNSGKSNAWNLQIFTAAQQSREFPKKFTSSTASTQIIPGGDKATTDRIRLRAPRKFPTYIFGYLHYTTAHETNFKSFFCVRLDGVPDYDPYGGQTINTPVNARGQVQLPPNT